MDKENVVCIYTQYYSSFEKKAVVLFLTIWVNLEDNMLSKISQTQKDKYYVVSLLCRIVKDSFD